MSTGGEREGETGVCGFVEESEQLNMFFGLVLWLLVFLPVRSKNTQYYLYLFRPRRDRAVSCLPPVSPSSPGFGVKPRAIKQTPLPPRDVGVQEREHRSTFGTWNGKSSLRSGTQNTPLSLRTVKDLSVCGERRDASRWLGSTGGTVFSLESQLAPWSC